MNLTNKYQAEEDRSSEFNLYIPKNERLDLFPYELSGNSETQLLDPSAIHENSSFCISSQESFRKPFVLQVDPNNSQLCDLADQFEITNEPSDIKAKRVHFKNPKVSMQEICEDLVGIIKSLQEKLDKFQESTLKSRQNIRESSASSSTNTHKSYVESISKLSSLGGYKISNQSHPKKQNSQLMELLIQLIQTKGQIKIYREQNQSIQVQLIQLRIENEQQKNALKRQNTEVAKMKELLKQYRSYHRNKLQKQNIQPLDNSLDRRLRTFESQQKKVSLKCFGELNFKETPKTPNNFTYHQYKSIFNTQKTKQRLNVRNEPNFVKQLAQFSCRTENKCQKQPNRTKLSFIQNKTQREGDDREFYQKYPFNELLELDSFVMEKEESEEFKIDHLETMESLPENSRSKQINPDEADLSSLLLKKYVPSSPY